MKPSNILNTLQSALIHCQVCKGGPITSSRIFFKCPAPTKSRDASPLSFEIPRAHQHTRVSKNELQSRVQFLYAVVHATSAVDQQFYVEWISISFSDSIFAKKQTTRPSVGQWVTQEVVSLQSIKTSMRKELTSATQHWFEVWKSLQQCLLVFNKKKAKDKHVEETSARRSASNAQIAGIAARGGARYLNRAKIKVKSDNSYQLMMHSQ